MPFEEAICAAIRERCIIRIFYNDALPGLRIVEPYTLGYSRADNLMLNGWYEAGASASGEGPGFRDFLIEKISSVDILQERFTTPRRGYVALGGTKFKSILCDVSRA